MAYIDLVDSLAEPSTRFQVAARLRESLPDSLHALLEGLANGRPSVRRWCAVVLDHAPHDSVVEEALRRATRDRNRKVRRAALHALACAHCKPDGCLTTDGVGFLIEGLLNDRSVAVRRTCAGNLMWGQAGRSERLVLAFRQVLRNDADTVVRERAAIFLTGCDVPRESRDDYTEWRIEWGRRIAELLRS